MKDLNNTNSKETGRDGFYLKTDRSGVLMVSFFNTDDPDTIRVSGEPLQIVRYN